MKIALLLGVLLFVAMFIAINPATLSSQDRVNSGESNRFIGAWRLASLEEPGADGKLHAADCTGQFVFTSDGHASVQVMHRNPPAQNNAAPVQYAQGGYEASFGSYTVDDAHTFTFHVEGALVRTLIDKDLKRAYEFTENQLIVRSADPNEHWKVVWKRY